MEAKAHKLGLSACHAEDRSHAFVEKVVPAKEQSEPAEVHQSCDVFFAGAEMGKPNRDGEAPFAWALRHACATEDEKSRRGGPP